MKKPIYQFRKFWHEARTSAEFTIRREWGGVGISLTRNDEEGVFGLRLPFMGFHLSREAWRWAPPKGFEEWRVSGEIYGGKFWVYGGRVPYARGEKDWPRAFRLPWFEWKHQGVTNVQQHAGHPYTYQWKYQPEVVQTVMALVSEETRSWQLTFAGVRLPWYRRRRSIWCDFSEELGSERGSWKGGTVGAGFTVEPTETWQDAYARMQKERSFCRR